MDKNSLILEIKNDLNSIKKQVEVTLAKIDVLEALIKLEVRSEELGISVQTSGEPSLLELSRVQPEITSGASNSESRDNACIVRDAEEVAEPVKQLEPIVEPESVVTPAPEVVAVSEVEPVVEIKQESIIEEQVSEPEPEIEESEPELEPIIEVEEEEKEEIIEEVEEESTPNSDSSTPRSVTEFRNLMSIIGLNDRFRFRHDLFSNSDEIFKETIEILNTIESFTQAVSYLEEKFQWDPEADTVVYFYEIIKPKF